MRSAKETDCKLKRAAVLGDWLIPRRWSAPGYSEGYEKEEPNDDRTAKHLQELQGRQTQRRTGRGRKIAVPARIHARGRAQRRFLHRPRRGNGRLHRPERRGKKQHHQNYERRPYARQRNLRHQRARAVEGADGACAGDRCGVRTALAALVGRARRRQLRAAARHLPRRRRRLSKNPLASDRAAGSGRAAPHAGAAAFARTADALRDRRRAAA